jgi:hypothetical protein
MDDADANMKGGGFGSGRKRAPPPKFPKIFPTGRSQCVQPLFLALHQLVGNAAGDRQNVAKLERPVRKKKPYNRSIIFVISYKLALFTVISMMQ